jgi:hypothetical protein
MKSVCAQRRELYTKLVNEKKNFKFDLVK